MIVVVGSGVAGCAAALAAIDRGGEVMLVTEELLDVAPAGNTPRAQGGVAAAIGGEDRPADHLADTLAAGAGLVDPVAAEILVREGATAMRRVIDEGFAADRGPDDAVSLGLEAAHTRARIVHAGGDRTGAVLHAHLTARVREAARSGRLALRERCRVESLVKVDGAVRGVRIGASGVRRPGAAAVEVVPADAVVLATGGYASLYPVSTNHPGNTGGGVVLAARAGALLADLEFVQFHPTALVTGAGEALLISEAVRGAGAVLRDDAGSRFLAKRHPLAELAPRDVVALETHRELARSGGRAVWLDATDIERSGGRGALEQRFPAISRQLRERGIDWRTDPVPVAPAAHYTMGGVASDLGGRATLPGLFVAGEVAATGVHGANRLASNSLLEGLVFGRRAGRAAAAYRPDRDPWTLAGAGIETLVARAHAHAHADAPAHEAFGGLDGSGNSDRGPAGMASGHARELAGDTEHPHQHEHPHEHEHPHPHEPEAALERAVGAHLGIERHSAGLATVLRISTAAAGHPEPSVRDRALLAAAIAHAASARTESRGAHRRADHPNTDADQAVRNGFSYEAAPSSTETRAATAALRTASAHHSRSVPAC